MIECQIDIKIKTIQTDSGSECKVLIAAVEKCGVVHRYNCPHTSKKNRVVECCHDELLKKKTIMPLVYWP